MAFTAYRTWVAGEIVTAAILNQQIRDNGRYLRGNDGVVTIDSGIIIDATDGDEYLRLPALTTSETTSTLTTEANVAYDETLHKVKYRSSGSNEVVLARDDVDDIPVDAASAVPISSNWAYDFVNTLTASADIPFANGAGSWTRLPKGTAGQVLRMNSTVSAPEWANVITTTVRKSADESVSSSAVLQNDDALVFNVASSARWWVEAYLRLGSNGNPGLQYKFTLPAGATLLGMDSVQKAIATSAAQIAEIDLASAQSYANLTISPTRLFTIEGIYAGASVSGNIQFQWAQQSATGEALTVFSNSYLKMTQLA